MPQRLHLKHVAGILDKRNNGYSGIIGKHGITKNVALCNITSGNSHRCSRLLIFILYKTKAITNRNQRDGSR